MSVTLHPISSLIFILSHTYCIRNHMDGQQGTEQHRERLTTLMHFSIALSPCSKPSFIRSLPSVYESSLEPDPQLHLLIFPLLSHYCSLCVAFTSLKRQYIKNVIIFIYLLTLMSFQNCMLLFFHGTHSKNNQICTCVHFGRQ